MKTRLYRVGLNQIIESGVFCPVTFSATVTEGAQHLVGGATAEKVGWIREAAGPRFDALELEIGAYFTFVGPGTRKIAEGMGGSMGLSGAAMRAHPHVLWPPAIALVLTTLAFNFLGDGLRDAFDPRMKGTF